MLEQVDLTLKVSKAEYRRQLPLLQANLYDLAHEVFTAKIPTMIVFEGWAAAGKGSTINVLAERLDPRGFRVVPIQPPRTQETRYPWMWRFWQKIPARGQMVAFDTSWYRRVLVDRATKTVRHREWEAAYQDIREFEEQLTADGAILLKFWLHIGRKEQAVRMKKLLKDKLTAWQISAEDAVQHKSYNAYCTMVEEMLARTDSAYAPWTIVEATDRYFTRVKVFQTIIRTLEQRLNKNPARVAEPKTKEADHA